MDDWFTSEVCRYHQEHKISPWVPDSRHSWSRIIHIAYPSGVYFIVEKLQDDSSWADLGNTFHSVELAKGNAQKLANSSGVPHRVREIVAYE